MIKSCLFLILGLLLLCSCGSKTTVILLPEEDGQTGQVVVKNQAAETVLTQPYTYAAVSNDTSSPESKPITQDSVTTSYDGLIKAEPLKPASFILYFKSDTVTLTPDSMKMIPQVIKTAQERKPSLVSVIGHTDTKGEASYNYELSVKRAKAVVERLKESGVQLKKITVTYHGENDLLIPTKDDVSEPRNRRVEIMIR